MTQRVEALNLARESIDASKAGMVSIVTAVGMFVPFTRLLMCLRESVIGRPVV